MRPPTTRRLLGRLAGAAAASGLVATGLVVAATPASAAACSSTSGVTVVVDFEGQPTRAPEERRALDTPLRDLASLVRSIDHCGRYAVEAHGGEAAVVEPWIREARDELLAGYGLSVCCFRHTPAHADEPALDAHNERILQALQRDGRVYLSNATVDGRFALRACITNFRTTRADVERVLTVIRELAG